MTSMGDNDIDYKQLTVKELKLIINGYGIIVDIDEKKEDIIKKIYNYKEALFKYQSESIINNQQNIFTSKINDLKYKEIEEYEILFWKVWKNKVTFKKITSYLSLGFSNSYKYKDIIHVDWIIENGYFQLLREKVERNELLLFNSTTTTLTSPFDLVFQSINQDDQINYQFYQKLFKNYYELNSYINLIDVDIIIGCTIYNNCIPALKVLIQEYNYKINQLMILNIIQSYSLKTIQYTLSTLNNIETTPTQPPLSSIINFSLLDINKLSINKKIFKILNWISSYYKSNENIKIQWSNGIELLFNFNPLYDKFTMNDLIESCIFISSNYPTIHDDDTTIYKLSKKEIESIKLNFNHKQLKSQIKYSLHGNQIVENKFVIKQLLDSYYSVYTQLNPKSSNFLYYLNFECNNLCDNIDNSGSTNEKISIINNNNGNEERNFKYSLKYGNLNYLKSLDVSCLTGGVIRKDIKKTLANLYKYKQYPMILFKYCKDIQMQKKFIYDFSNYHKNKLSPVQKMHPYLLFYLVIELDNIQLVKFTIETLGKLLKYSIANRNVHYFIKFNYNIQRYIQSIEMMNYLMDNGFIDHFSIGNLISWYTRGRIDLLSNFEKILLKSNLSEIYKSIINSASHIGFKDNGIINGQLIKSFVYIIKNSNVYKHVDKLFGKLMLDTISIINNEHKHLKDVKFIIENTSPHYKFYPEKMYNFNSLNSNKLLNWSLKHYHNDGDENTLIKQIENLKLNDGSGNSSSINDSNRCKINKFYTFYLTGKIDKFKELLEKNQHKQISSIKLILEMVATRGNVEVFDILLKFYFNSIIQMDNNNNGGNEKIIKTKRKELIQFLKTSSRYGRIEIFQHLLFNYSFILLPKSKGNNGYFSKSVLYDTMEESLKNNNFHLISFFKNTLSFK